MLSQIRNRSCVASVSIFPCLTNFGRTTIQKHFNPLPVNRFSIIEINQCQPVLQCSQTICERRFPGQGSISNMFQTVLPPDNGPMLLLGKLCHLYFRPLVECTVLGLPQPVGELLQSEFGLLQANWGFAFWTSQV